MIIIMIIARKSHLFDQLTIKAGRTNTEWNTYQNPSLIILIRVDTPLKINIHQCFTLISHASNHIIYAHFTLKVPKETIYCWILCFIFVIGNWFIIWFATLSIHQIQTIIWRPIKSVAKENWILYKEVTIKFVIGFNHLTSYSSSAKGDLHLAHQRALHLHTIIYNKPMKSPLTQLFVLKLILSVYSSNSTN